MLAISDLYEASIPAPNAGPHEYFGLLIGTGAVALIYIALRQSSTRRKVVLATLGLVVGVVAILVASGR